MAADVLRLGAFGALAFVPSLGLMIACALVAGIGTALFNPSALASLSQVARPEHRPAAMSLFAALDDLGLTLGPAIAGALLLVVRPADPDGDQRRHLHDLGRCCSRRSRSSVRVARAAWTRCSPSLRAGAREIVARPGVRILLGSSTVAVIAVGMVNVGEVMLARELLGVGGSGLAALMTASGVGTFLGSTFGARTGTTLAVAQGLHGRARVHGRRPVLCAVAPVLLAAGLSRSRSAASATASRSSTTACCSPTPCPRRCTAACSRCTRRARRRPSCIAFVLAGALISSLGIQAMFLCGGLALIVDHPDRAAAPERAVAGACGRAGARPLRPRPGTT